MAVATVSVRRERAATTAVMGSRRRFVDYLGFSVCLSCSGANRSASAEWTTDAPAGCGGQRGVERVAAASVVERRLVELCAAVAATVGCGCHGSVPSVEVSRGAALGAAASRSVAIRPSPGRVGWAGPGGSELLTPAACRGADEASRPGASFWWCRSPALNRLSFVDVMAPKGAGLGETRAVGSQIEMARFAPLGAPNGGRLSLPRRVHDSTRSEGKTH